MLILDSSHAIVLPSDGCYFKTDGWNGTNVTTTRYDIRSGYRVVQKYTGIVGDTGDLALTYWSVCGACIDKYTIYGTGYWQGWVYKGSADEIIPGVTWTNKADLNTYSLNGKKLVYKGVTSINPYRTHPYFNDYFTSSFSTPHVWEFN